MFHTLHRSSAAIMLGIGVLHTGLTPIFYSKPSLGALWFAGTGLAAMFLAWLNVALWRAGGSDPWIRRLGRVANVGFALFMAIGLSIMPSPQAVLFLVVALLLAGAAFANPMVRAR